jgi:transposase
VALDGAEEAGIARGLHRCQARQGSPEDADQQKRPKHAVGIARIMQCGWYKEVRVKDLDSHAIKALLVSRALLVKIKRDVENQIRGLLKNLGLVIGRAKMNVFAVRAGELIQDRPELAAAVAPLLKTREVIERQIADLDRKVMRMARNDIQVRRFMTVPGVRAITALCIGRQSTTQPGSRNREVLEPMPG